MVDKIVELRLVGGPHPLGLMLALTFDEPSPNAWRKSRVVLSITAIPFVEWVSGPPGVA